MKYLLCVLYCDLKNFYSENYNLYHVHHLIF